MRNLSAAILALALAAAAQMAYATQQNLIDRFGERELIELTDRADPPTGAIDAAVVTKALADADGAINGYLAVKYQLPISPVPVMFERFGCDIARYYLYEDRVTDQVRRRYEDAIKYLEGVASGKVNIGVDASNQAPSSSGGPEVSAPDRIFTGDSLADFTGS